MPIYSKTQEQYLLDELNRLNPDAALPASASNVVFGKPVPLAATKAGEPNARVKVRAKQRRGYVGEQEFDYEQLDIATYFKNVDVRITLPGITKLRQAIVNINGRYGLNLVPTDVEDVTLVSGKRVTLRMSPTCLQFKGSVEVLFKPGALDLNTLIVNKALSALRHPVEIDGRKCSKMLSWGIDFTDYRPQLQALTQGGLSGGANQTSGRSDELVNLMVALGFPRWNYQGAKWRIVATSTIEDCNKQYDMVGIVSNVNDPGVSGDIYLHFNA